MFYKALNNSDFSCFVALSSPVCISFEHEDKPVMKAMHEIVLINSFFDCSAFFFDVVFIQHICCVTKAYDRCFLVQSYANEACRQKEKCFMLFHFFCENNYY